jgi:hypothetical protein
MLHQWRCQSVAKKNPSRPRHVGSQARPEPRGRRVALAQERGNAAALSQHVNADAHSTNTSRAISSARTPWAVDDMETATNAISATARRMQSTMDAIASSRHERGRGKCRIVKEIAMVALLYTRMMRAPDC